MSRYEIEKLLEDRIVMWHDWKLLVFKLLAKLNLSEFSMSAYSLSIFTGQ
jgi:hypothetical protein